MLTLSEFNKFVQNFNKYSVQEHASETIDNFCKCKENCDIEEYKKGMVEFINLYNEKTRDDVYINRFLIGKDINTVPPMFEKMHKILNDKEYQHLYTMMSDSKQSYIEKLSNKKITLVDVKKLPGFNEFYDKYTKNKGFRNFKLDHLQHFNKFFDYMDSSEACLFKKEPTVYEYARMFSCYTLEEQYPHSSSGNERKTCNLCHSGVVWWELYHSKMIISKTIPDEELLMRRIAEVLGIRVYIRYANNSWKTPEFSNLEFKDDPLGKEDYDFLNKIKDR